jgi:hypothetical protein
MVAPRGDEAAGPAVIQATTPHHFMKAAATERTFDVGKLRA